MLKKYSIWLFIGIVVSLPILAFELINWYENKFQALPVYNVKEQTISDFKMVNQQGKAITLADWNDKIVVADFFFTHCLSVCPKMTNNLKKVQAVYLNDNDILINSFSVDPERDSAGRLKSYANQFGVNDAKWNLLTGNKKEIYRLARKSFSIVATDGDGGPDDFIHSENLVLVDKRGRIRGYYNGTSEKETKKLINDIKKLKVE
jgi:protein SCO1